jgi:DNA-binding transcriptional LysR family regulator
MSETGKLQHGQVTIACVPTAAFYFLPRVIRRFHALHPKIRIRILDLSASEGLKSVANGECEFGISMLGSADPDVTFTPLMEDPFVLACHHDHPLARRRKIRWSDLADHLLIGVSRNSGNRTILDNALANLDVRLNWFYEVNHLSTSLGLVEAGVGISVLPRLATPQEDHPTIVTRPIADPTVVRTDRDRAKAEWTTCSRGNEVSRLAAGQLDARMRTARCGFGALARRAGSCVSGLMSHAVLSGAPFHPRCNQRFAMAD